MAARPSARKVSFRDHLAAIKDLRSNGAAWPVVCVVGTSDFLAQRTVDILRQQAEATGAHCSSLEAVSLQETTVVSLGSQSSLFEPATLYVLRRCEQAKEKLPKLLHQLPPPTQLANRLCLVYRGESLPAALRTELDRLGAKQIGCFDPWPNELSQVLEHIASDHELALQADASELLLQTHGTDLAKLNNEIAKLRWIIAPAPGDASAPRRPLAAATIAPHLGLLREDDAFTLDRLLLQRKWPQAQALSTALLARGEKALALLGIVAGHCRHALLVSEALARGVPQHDVGTAVRLSPTTLKAYLQAFGRSTDTRPYLQALHLCQETDVRLKSGRIDEGLLIGRIIATLGPHV